MNKLRNMLIAAIAIVALSTSAFAGSVGIGVTGNLALISATGSGAEGTDAEVNQSAEAHKNSFVGSLFAEYSFDNGFTLGLDYIPGSAKVSKGVSRTDIELSAAGGAATTLSVTRTAQAEVENHMTYYAEIPLHAGLYVKGGWVQLDVNTQETGGAQSYGNATVDGILYGIGYKNEFGTSAYYKVEGTQTSFDTLTLVGTGGVDSPTTIKADLDVAKLTFALGYKF